MVISLSDEYFKAIGGVSVNFSALELTIHTLIWRFLGDEQTGQVITAQLSFKRARGLLRVLATRKLGEAHASVAELDDLLKRAAQAEEQRNQIIHSIWAPHVAREPEGVRVKIVTKKGKLVFQVESVSPARIGEVAESIGNVALGFAGQLEKISLAP
jgi:hypothetical protein